jgi:hypothetical protein|tara:strand:- start:422 stop:1204 length:783 start_codon:yes stop_codon:yes gene_type:complete
MKKIVRMTSNDIESIVKKIVKEENINELDKKTYTRAAGEARERGMSKLGDRFASHGRDFGTNIVGDISFDIQYYGTNVVKNIEFSPDGLSFRGDVNKGDDGETSKFRFDIFVDERNNKIKTYLHGNNVSLPSTVKDARNYLQLLNDNGVDTFGIRPKQITSGYADFVTENDISRIVKKVITEQSQPNKEEVVMGCVRDNVKIKDMASLPMSCIDMVITKDPTKMWGCMSKIDQKDAELIWSKIEPISKCVESKLGGSTQY